MRQRMYLRLHVKINFRTHLRMDMPGRPTVCALKQN